METQIDFNPFATPVNIADVGDNPFLAISQEQNQQKQQQNQHTIQTTVIQQQDQSEVNPFLAITAVQQNNKTISSHSTTPPLINNPFAPPPQAISTIIPIFKPPIDIPKAAIQQPIQPTIEKIPSQPELNPFKPPVMVEQIIPKVSVVEIPYQSNSVVDPYNSIFQTDFTIMDPMINMYCQQFQPISQQINNNDNNNLFSSNNEVINQKQDVPEKKQEKDISTLSSSFIMDEINTYLKELNQRDGQMLKNVEQKLIYARQQHKQLQIQYQNIKTLEDLIEQKQQLQEYLDHNIIIDNEHSLKQDIQRFQGYVDKNKKQVIEVEERNKKLALLCQQCKKESETTLSELNEQQRKQKQLQRDLEEWVRYACATLQEKRNITVNNMVDLQNVCNELIIKANQQKQKNTIKIQQQQENIEQVKVIQLKLEQEKIQKTKIQLQNNPEQQIATTNQIQIITKQTDQSDNLKSKNKFTLSEQKQ